MKYTKEAKIWLKQQECNIEYCQELIDTLKRQINLHKKRIELEQAQIDEIKKMVEKFKKDWK